METFSIVFSPFNKWEWRIRESSYVFLYIPGRTKSIQIWNIHVFPLYHSTLEYTQSYKNYTKLNYVILFLIIASIFSCFISLYFLKKTLKLMWNYLFFLKFILLIIFSHLCRMEVVTNLSNVVLIGCLTEIQRGRKWKIFMTEFMVTYCY